MPHVQRRTSTLLSSPPPPPPLPLDNQSFGFLLLRACLCSFDRDTINGPAPFATMPDFQTGVYLITNVLHPNNAALFNDNANEPVRGILPVPIDTIPRDNEKVRSTTVLERFPHVSSVGASASWSQPVQHQERPISKGRWKQSDVTQGWRVSSDLGYECAMGDRGWTGRSVSV